MQISRNPVKLTGWSGIASCPCFCPGAHDSMLGGPRRKHLRLAAPPIDIQASRAPSDRTASCPASHSASECVRHIRSSVSAAGLCVRCRSMLTARAGESKTAAPALTFTHLRMPASCRFPRSSLGRGSIRASTQHCVQVVQELAASRTVPLGRVCRCGPDADVPTSMPPRCEVVTHSTTKPNTRQARISPITARGTCQVGRDVRMARTDRLHRADHQSRRQARTGA